MTSQKSSAANQAEFDFDACFDSYWQRIYVHLLGMLDDPQEAQDLALETFYRLSTQPLLESGRLAGWLYRVATNLGLNRLRSQRRRQNYERAAAEKDLLLNTPFDTEQEAERRLDRQRVRGVLAGMQPRQAQMLMLRHAGLSYQELAQALGLKSTSVGKQLARAEAEFEKRFRALEGDR